MAQGGDPDGDDRVLSPDELDIEEQEDVASLGDGRYVIGSDGPPEAPDSGGRRQDASSGGGADRSAHAQGDAAPSSEEPFEDAAASETDQAEPAESESTGGESAFQAPGASGDSGGSRQLSGSRVKNWLSDELATHDSTYAYHIAAKSGGSVTHQQLATDDIGTAFDGLLVWYARQVARGTPVDEALGILLSESTVQVRYPTSRLVAYLEEHDLGPEDSIGDLVEVISEEDGLAFPRRD